MIKIKGVSQAISELRAMQDELMDDANEMTVVVLQGVSAHTVPFVPVNTSTLMNSELRQITQTNNRVFGTLSYGLDGSTNPDGTPVVEYAAKVHDGPQRSWKKPGASNKYLDKGFDLFVKDDLSSVIEAYFK